MFKHRGSPYIKIKIKLEMTNSLITSICFNANLNRYMLKIRNIPSNKVPIKLFSTKSRTSLYFKNQNLSLI